MLDGGQALNRKRWRDPHPRLACGKPGYATTLRPLRGVPVARFRAAKPGVLPDLTARCRINRHPRLACGKPGYGRRPAAVVVCAGSPVSRSEAGRRVGGVGDHICSGGGVTCGIIRGHV